MDDKKAPFGNDKDEDTTTSSIPTRKRKDNVEPMPDGSPGAGVDDMDRAQIPTEVDDSGTTRRD